MHITGCPAPSYETADPSELANRSLTSEKGPTTIADGAGNTCLVPAPERTTQAQVDRPNDRHVTVRRWPRPRRDGQAQVGGFIGWLARSEHGPEALADPHVRDWAVRD